MISLIESIQQDENIVYVRAIVEDIVLVYQQTMESPAEYGPAVCETSFSLNEDETLPTNEDELVDFLNNLDLDWQVIDNSDYY